MNDKLGAASADNMLSFVLSLEAYFRAIRVKLGRAMREHYDLTEPMPEKVSKLLEELEKRGAR
jgi:hypothetical protein